MLYSKEKEKVVGKFDRVWRGIRRQSDGEMVSGVVGLMIPSLHAGSFTSFFLFLSLKPIKKKKKTHIVGTPAPLKPITFSLFQSHS